MTWESFLVLLRVYLEDTSATTPRWTDQLLYLYTVDAIFDYSRWFPKRVDQSTLAMVNGISVIPTNCIDIIDVECPLGRFLRQRQETPGRKYNKRVEPVYYSVENGSLYLDASYNGNVYITYESTHTTPTNESDDHFTFSVPDMDLELLRLYVKAQIHIQMRTKTARLDRFEVGSGRRDDNPLLPETVDIMKEYYRKINDRIRGGAIKLYKAGR